VNREELTAIADTVIINWGIDLGGDRRKAFYRTWWRYLGDLEMTSTQLAVDSLVLADKPFAPRAGTIRRMVLAELLSDVMTMDLAWAQAATRIKSVEQGTWSDVSPMVAQAMAEAGLTGTGKQDQEAFIRAWRRVVETFELERLGIPAEDTDIS